MPYYCPQCGKENNDSAKFCISCGRNLSSFVLDSRYEVICTIKAGAMGCVYKARDTRLNHLVALKKMLLHSRNPEDVKYAEQRFMEEARLLSQLHHGGLPKVSDYFTAIDPQTKCRANYLVMTFIEGKDLETIMTERGISTPFPIDEVLDYFWQILEILHYLHSHEPPIIYRDLKPSNIMVNRGKIFLVDFGIARIFTPQQKGTLIGTPGYAPIEQYKGYAEPRSDLYSLGAVIHYLLTGANPEDSSRPPFTFESPANVNPNIPDYLNSIVMSLLELVLDNRPESAEKVMELLGSSKAPTRPQKISNKKSLAVKQRKQSSKIQTKMVKKTSSIKNRMETCDDIFEAITRNDIQALKIFIQESIDINDRKNQGTTPLHWASYKGNPEIVEILLLEGAHINSKDIDKSTPLHVAAAGGSLKVAELLLSMGARVNEKDIEGFTPLHVAVQEGHFDIAKQLIENKANINEEGNNYSTPLHMAAMGNSKDIAALLIAKGASIDAQDYEGFTPLHRAVQEGHYEITRLLLSQGADVNSTTYDESTALHWAAYKGFRRIAELLISEGANINAKDEDSSTPLHVAVAGNSEEIVKLLVIKGANIDARDNEGFTPLHVAVQEDHKDILELLIAAEANINEIDNSGRTPLKMAIQLGKKEIARALRILGAAL